MTVGELTKWTVLRSWGPRKLAELADWRQNVVTLPYSELVAVRWGELQARAERRGRPRPVNDTWIAACCLVRNPLRHSEGRLVPVDLLPPDR